MEKREVIASIARKTNVDEETAEKIVDAAILEAVSPEIFRKPGESAACASNNHCKPE